MNKFSEKDWKLFRNKISDWKEAYMEKLNKEYVALLSGKGNASDKFWKLEKRIREDKKDCGVQCEMSRSNQFYIMLSLLNEGAITFVIRTMCYIQIIAMRLLSEQELMQ